MKAKINIHYLTRAAIIAAIYTAITLIAVMTPFGTFIFGPIQIRISEALTVLPALFPSAIPGLFVGCLVTNIIGAATGLAGGALDIVFGSLATLLAAYLSYKLRRYKWLVPLPPVIINALVIGWVLHYVFELSLIATMLTVGAGQAIACYLLGLPLLLVLERTQIGKAKQP